MADKKVALELEVNIKKGDLTLGELNQQFKQVGETIIEQKDILIEFQRELKEVERIRAKTSPTNYQRIKELKNRETQLKDAISDQRISLRELNNERSKASSAIKQINTESVKQNKIIRAVDKLTGGMATKVVNLYKGFSEGVKAVKLFSRGLSGLQKALIGTGIGAFVVALGVVAAYWDEIVNFIEGGNKKLEKQLQENDKISEELNHQLTLLTLQEEILKQQGLDTENIVAEKKKVILLQKEQLKEELELLKQQQIRLAQQAVEPSLWKKAISAISGYGRALGSISDEEREAIQANEQRIKETEESAKKLELALAKIDAEKRKKEEKQNKDKDKADAEAKKAKDKADKERADALEAIRLAEIDTEDERRQEELDKIDRYYEELIQKAEEYGEDTTELEKAREAKKQEIFDKQKAKDEAEEAKRLLKEQKKKIEALQAESKIEEDNFRARRADLRRRQALLLDDETLSKEQRLELEEKFDEESEAIDKDFLERKKERDEALKQSFMELANTLVDFASASSRAEEERLSRELEMENQRQQEKEKSLQKTIENAEKGSQEEIDAQKSLDALKKQSLEGGTKAQIEAEAALEKQKEKSFKIEQNAAIGRTLIDTAQGAIKAYTTQFIPGVPSSIIRGALAAALVTSAGLAQVAAIKKQKFYGSGGAGISPPSQPTLGGGDVGTQPRGFTPTIVDTDVPTTKVIVTETDIRSVSRNVDGVYSRATVVQ